MLVSYREDKSFALMRKWRKLIRKLRKLIRKLRKIISKLRNLIGKLRKLMRKLCQKFIINVLTTDIHQDNYETTIVTFN